MRDNMNQSQQQIEADIRKGYEELMKRNEETLQWMKRVGLTK
jgi:hypothetical protein